MNERKNLLVFLLIVMLALICLWASGVWGEVFQPPLEYYSVEPAEITEPLKTWYLGAAAFDVPKSLEPRGFKVKFRSGSLPETTIFEFLEQKIVPLLDDAVGIPMPGDLGKTKQLGRERIGPILGYSETLYVFFYSMPTDGNGSSEKYFLYLVTVFGQGEGVTLLPTPNRWRNPKPRILPVNSFRGAKTRF